MLQGGGRLAIPEFEQAATLDPHDTELAREIGVTLTCLRRYAEAYAAFARSPFRPTIPTPMSIAGALQLSGDLAAASKVLAAVPPDLDPQGAVSLQRFLLTMGMRQPDAALAVLVKTPAWLNDGIDGLIISVTLCRGRRWR